MRDHPSCSYGIISHRSSGLVAISFVTTNSLAGSGKTLFRQNSGFVSGYRMTACGKSRCCRQLLRRWTTYPNTSGSGHLSG